MGGPVDTFVVRLVLAMTILAWGSVLLHDLVTPDDPSETTLAPAAAVDRPDDALPSAPGLPAPTTNVTSAPNAPR